MCYITIFVSTLKRFHTIQEFIAKELSVQRLLLLLPTLEKIMHRSKEFEFIITFISCTLTFLVILSFAIFPKMWSKIFMRIILYAAISIFIANATVFSDNPSDYYLCYFQGMFQQFFYPASWLWTTVLSYLIYCLVMHGKVEMEELKMHLICWGIPLFTTLLPLSTSTYGNDDDGVCWLVQRSSDNLRDWTTFWQILTFGVIAFVCTICMVYWGVRMYHKVHSDPAQCSPAVLNAMRTLFIYPIIIVVCWMPQALLNTFDPDLPADSNKQVGVNSLAILQGGISAIAFFYNSKETRSNWTNLCITLFPCCAKCLAAPKAAKKAEEHNAHGQGRATIVYSVDEDFEGDEYYTGKSESAMDSAARPTDLSTTLSPLSDLTISTYGGHDDQL